MGLKNKVPAPVRTETGTTLSFTDSIVADAAGEVNETGQAAVAKKRRRITGQKRAALRRRNFATVVYPESAPIDWKERLSEQHVAALVSPLHDRDVNPSGAPKKPHYHVLLMFESPKDFDNQVKPIFDMIGGVGREYVNSMRGYARYLCHLDNPEKAQYDKADVIQLGGADYAAVVHLPTDDSRMLAELFAYIKANQIYSFAELLDICAVNNPDWFNLVTASRAYIVDKYIKSLMWERDIGYQRQDDKLAVDPATGEVLSSGDGVAGA